MGYFHASKLAFLSSSTRMLSKGFYDFNTCTKKLVSFQGLPDPLPVHHQVALPLEPSEFAFFPPLKFTLSPSFLLNIFLTVARNIDKSILHFI